METIECPSCVLLLQCSLVLLKEQGGNYPLQNSETIQLLFEWDREAKHILKHFVS